MEKVLEISHLSKKFGQQYALNDVNLSIRKGDVYGLIGKNGAGKTTLIKVITQLIQEGFCPFLLDVLQKLLDDLCQFIGFLSIE